MTVVVQNDTDDELRVDGAVVLRGDWDEVQTPQHDQRVPARSSVAWATRSSKLGAGTSGYLRLASPRGFVTLRWELPWTGAPVASIDSTGEGWRTKLRLETEVPDSVVVAVTIRFRE